MNENENQTVKYLRAMVYLQLQDQAGGASTFRGKPELLLAKAGFKAREIGDILGKKESAVAKAISRARLVSATEDSDE